MTERMLGMADKSSDLRVDDITSWVLAATAIGGRFFLAGESHKSGGQNWCLQSLSYNKCKHRIAASIRDLFCSPTLCNKALYTNVLSIDAIFLCCPSAKGT